MQTLTEQSARAEWRKLQDASAELAQIEAQRDQLRAALQGLFNSCSFYRHSKELSDAHPEDLIKNGDAYAQESWTAARAALAAVRDGGESL